MVLAMEHGRAGSLVWVLRKNGRWWPGKIENSSTKKTAVKLLGRENGSVEWFNLEKSRRIKAFRSVEFNDFIKSVESSQTSYSEKIAQYVHREDAILHALLLEKQEQGKGLKRPGNVKQAALYRTKRSRCAYLPVVSNNYVKRSALHSQSLKFASSSCAIEENSHKSSLAKETASSKLTASDSSESTFEDSDDDGNSQHTGSYSGRETRITNAQKKESLSKSSTSSLDSKFASGAWAQNWNLKEKCYSKSSSGTPDTVTNGDSSVVSRKQASNTQDLLMLDADYQEESRYKFPKEPCEHLEAIMLPNSTSGDGYPEDSSSESLYGPVYINLQDTIRTMLVDVDVTVQANYRKEQVPMVSLMSKLNKVAIVGHPIEVEVLEDKPEVLLVKNGSNHQMIDNGGSKIHQLVWRTSKRTPVCYLANHNSSASSNPEAKKNDIIQEESPLKPLTKGSFSLNNGHDLLIGRQISENVNFKKGASNILPGATCIPVNLIFSKLFSAVST